ALDNFEHLLASERRKAEDGAGVVRALMERVSTGTFLVTSRQRLDLEGEQEFPVPPLPVPAETDWRRGDSPSAALHHRLASLASYPSVQLFTDRVQKIKPDFQITPRNAVAVAMLCVRLEGIPLAIELAAARAQVLTPAQMLTQLENRFDFLVSRKRDAIDRHR